MLKDVKRFVLQSFCQEILPVLRPFLLEFSFDFLDDLRGEASSHGDGDGPLRHRT